MWSRRPRRPNVASPLSWPCRGRMSLRRRLSGSRTDPQALASIYHRSMNKLKTWSFRRHHARLTWVEWRIRLTWKKNIWRRRKCKMTTARWSSWSTWKMSRKGKTNCMRNKELRSWRFTTHSRPSRKTPSVRSIGEIPKSWNASYKKSVRPRDSPDRGRQPECLDSLIRFRVRRTYSWLRINRV